MRELTIGLLPQRKVNYRALLTSFVFQSMLVIVLIQTGVIQPVKLIKMSKTLIYTPLVVDTTPKFQPSVRGYIPPVAKLVVPKPSPSTKPQLIEPPKVELQAKALPTLPNVPTPLPKPMVKIGAFLPSAEKPTLSKSIPAAQVQTGGFGDPNGVKGVGNGNSKLTVASVGSFGMPSGPGYGNGTGGAHGKAGIGSAVQASGFDATATASPSTTKASVPQHDAGKAVEILGHVRPAYTEEGRKLGIQGEVLLRVKFTASGQVSIIKVIQSLGHGLDEQACVAAETIKFKPAEHNGQPIDSEATVHIIFELAS